MSAPKRKWPARWRKARNPDAGGRWDTPMNRMIWERDHGDDIELWRGGVKLATIKPGGRWSVHGTRHYGVAGSVDEAKAAVAGALAADEAKP